MNTQNPQPPQSASKFPPSDIRQLGREEMEALLPDYAFGALESADDKVRFEAALPLYPDVAEELRLIQDSFALVDEDFTALDREESQRLKNLTVHIQERLRRDAERRQHWFRLVKFFVPALAMCVVLAVISIPQGFQWMNLGNVRTESSLVTPEDLQRLQDVDAAALSATDAFHANIGEASEPTNDDKTAAMAARKMLDKETLRAIAANRSAFQDYFGSSVLDDISDEDAASLAVALKEML